MNIGDRKIHLHFEEHMHPLTDENNNLMRKARNIILAKVTACDGEETALLLRETFLEKKIIDKTKKIRAFDMEGDF